MRCFFGELDFLYLWIRLLKLYHVLGNMFGFSTLSGKHPKMDFQGWWVLAKKWLKPGTFLAPNIPPKHFDSWIFDMYLEDGLPGIGYVVRKIYTLRIQVCPKKGTTPTFLC